MAEPVEASSLYSGAPLFSFGFGVQFNVGNFLRPVYSEDFHEMSPLKSLDCIFQFLGEGPQFAVVDFDCVAVFLPSTILFSVLKASIARICLRLMSFSVSSRLPSNLHFFHFSLPYRIIS